MKTTNPMAKYDVFISYSRDDSEFAEKVCAVFDAYKKFYKFEYFFDREEIKSANEYLERISEAISECNTMFFLASKNSYSSRFCSKELLFANEYNVTIHRYCIDNSKPPKKINLLLIDQHFQEASTCPIEKMVCQVLSNALKKDILPLSVLCCSDNDTPPLQPRNPINWRKLIKSGAIGAFAVALMALFAYALFAPDTNIVSSYSVDSVSIMEARLAKAEAEREAHEEAARLAKEEAERKVHEEAARLAKAEAERKAHEEAVRLAKAEAERKAHEEAARLAKAEAEREAHEEAARKTYKVGDYYNDGTKEGVVFEVSADGKHGKIVSMTQSSKWLDWTSDKAERKRLIGADSKTDGAYNMARVKAIANWREKYPAFKWCADLGEGWYLPAIEELKKFTLNDAVHDAVNRTLTSKGGVKLFNRKDRGGSYCSSTESNERSLGEFCAWYVSMRGGYTSTSIKYNIYYYVRAVSAF